MSITSNEVHLKAEGRSSSEAVLERSGPSYPLNTLYFYLTEGCNLACRHCWIAPTFQTGERKFPSLDVDLFRSILTQAKALGLGGVKLTGGEPLLHPRIRELIEIVKAENLRLTMETNGVLCTPELARLIASCRNSFVSVSLDGADSETHEWMRGVEGCYSQALRGIRNFVDVGIHPQVIMSIVRRNREQMEHVVRLAELAGANSVKFNLVQPTARGVRMHEEQETLSIEELIETGHWVETTLSASASIRLHYSHPVAFRPQSKMFAPDGGCGTCGIFSILGVLADGSYALCGIGEQVPDFIFGHAAKDRLEDVWRETPMLKEIREGLPARLEGICGTCLMRRFCLGSCIAQNYYTHKSLWAPFWYCDQAQRAGLFPGSRQGRKAEVAACAA
jgi:SynChlorMet cassette radical SAM/SPASM protein ScmF